LPSRNTARAEERQWPCGKPKRRKKEENGEDWR
jgi:hypothetical protein